MALRRRTVAIGAAIGALAAAGGGTVRGVERQDGDDPGVDEVEVRRTDGSEVDVLLDAHFGPVGRTADDDSTGVISQSDDAGGS